MAYSGPIYKSTNVTVNGNKFVYFGPFYEGTYVEYLEISACDSSFASSQVNGLGLSLFESSAEPFATFDAFLTGRSLVDGGSVVNGVQTANVLSGSFPIYQRIPICRALRTHTWWLGILFFNGGLDGLSVTLGLCVKDLLVSERGLLGFPSPVGQRAS